jgi:4'-phosphopantetheinyl transferase
VTSSHGELTGRAPRASVPGPGEAVVRLLWIPDSAAAASAAAGMLDAAEARRIAAFQDPAARERYLTSHVGLRILLGGRLGIAPAAVEFVRERCGMPDCDRPHGRPAVAGRPDLRFSMAHAGDAALYALAAAPVGADIESATIAGDGLERAAARLHPAERAAVAALPAERRREALLGCWVRKEAYLKGIGTGLAGGIGTHHVGLADRLAAPGAPPVPEGWSLVDVPVPDGYQAAVAVRTTGTAVLRLGRLRLE